MRRFQIEVPSDPAFLRMVRTAVDTLCAMGGMEEDGRCMIVLAVDEACSNIIRHSYDGAADKRIICEGRLEEGAISFILRDFGKKVEPSRIQPRDLADLRPGGLGVHFMRKVMDSVEFEDCGAAGTCLTMRKRLPANRGG
ncbi:MAG: ATP-binding protein [Candidatus Tectomicrobia bacterium]|nr:ATP-binding protein [Candidatus Tectomicrobia bacterium]